MQRVIGGDISPRSVPWQAFIIYKNNNPTCGAIVLDQTTILTAAHCLKAKGENGTKYIDKNPKNYQVSVGVRYRPSVKENSLNIRADDIIIHPKYDANGPLVYGNDIAMIKLPWKHRITYGWLYLAKDYLFNPVSPVCLPPKGYEDIEEKCESLGMCNPTSKYMPNKCIVSGWGLTEPRK